MAPKQKKNHTPSTPKVKPNAPPSWPTPPVRQPTLSSSARATIHATPTSINDSNASDLTKQPKTGPSNEDIPSIHLPDIQNDILTPRSSSVSIPKSPVSAATGFSSRTIIEKDAGTTRDLEAVSQLLDTMKMTLGAVGATFDTLGEQTMKVAALGPAIDANHQISLVRKQLDDQHRRQEERMQGMKAMLKNELMDGQLQDRMKETASVIVKEIIRREIADRVRKQLEGQIDEGMRDQVARYQRQVLEVKTMLHNSEARRHNALIRSNSLDEPLKPLLRPLQPQLQTIPSIPSTPSENTIVNVTPTAEAAPEESTTPQPQSATEAQGSQRGPPKLSELHIENNPRTMIREMGLVPPTPSPLFPRNLSSLMKLGTEDAKTLAKEYGLSPNPVGSTSPEIIPEAEAEGSREEILNRFMSHIGVGFHIMPSPRDVASPQSPIHLMSRA